MSPHYVGPWHLPLMQNAVKSFQEVGRSEIHPLCCISRNLKVGIKFTDKVGGTIRFSHKDNCFFTESAILMQELTVNRSV